MVRPVARTVATGVGVNVARDAEAAVEDRMRSYGHPADNHACTAALWSAWLERRHGFRLELTAADVCWLNVLQKLSREAHSREPDNIVDVIGFAINAEMVS